jgi:hypothetical protein
LNEPTGTIIAKILIQIAAMVAIVTGLALITRDPVTHPIQKQKPPIEAHNRIDPYASYFFGRK